MFFTKTRWCYWLRGILGAGNDQGGNLCASYRDEPTTIYIYKTQVSIMTSSMGASRRKVSLNTIP